MAEERKSQEYDLVNKPRHYNVHPSGVECIQITEWMPFCIGSAMKYLWRCGLKDDEIQELEKARWYITREIDRRKRLKEKTAAEQSALQNQIEIVDNAIQEKQSRQSNAFRGKMAWATRMKRKADRKK